MKALPPAYTANWAQYAGYWCPESVDSPCPGCHKHVTFALTGHHHDAARNTISATSRCPACRKEVSIWVIKPSPAHHNERQQAECIAMFPEPPEERRPIEGIDLVPRPIANFYHEALAVYNAKAWSSTATLCRVTLEGIAQHLLPKLEDQKKPSLDSMLREIAKKPDLGESITRLADSVRKGGNLGAHFDDERVPDKELATTILNILEYLLEFFFTIPKMIENTRGVLEKPRPPAN